VYGLLYKDQLQPVAQLDADNNVVSVFTYGTRGNVPDFMTKNGQTYRFVVDHLGSVRLLVNAADGSIAQRIDYDEFGNVLLDTAPGFQPFGFAGGLYDADTGLVRFGARDYDAATGRWAAKDPLLFGGGQANLHVYVGDDPVNRRDPTGLADFFCGIDIDDTLVFGLDFNGGYVLDTDDVLGSGFYKNPNASIGLNGGLGVTVGGVFRDIEGEGRSIDINADVIGITFIFDSKGFNGVSFSFGPGLGFSYSGGGTNTYTWQDIFSR
jgi:RHS repeat-associated protein